MYWRGERRERNRSVGRSAVGRNLGDLGKEKKEKPLALGIHTRGGEKKRQTQKEIHRHCRRKRVKYGEKTSNKNQLKKKRGRGWIGRGGGDWGGKQKTKTGKVRTELYFGNNKDAKKKKVRWNGGRWGRGKGFCTRRYKKCEERGGIKCKSAPGRGGYPTKSENQERKNEKGKGNGTPPWTLVEGQLSIEAKKYICTPRSWQRKHVKAKKEKSVSPSKGGAQGGRGHR